MRNLPSAVINKMRERENKMRENKKRKERKAGAEPAYKKRARRAGFILSVIIAILSRLSYCFAYDSDWVSFVKEPAVTAVSVVVMAALFYLCIYFFFTKTADMYKDGEEKEQSLKFIIACAGIILLCWVPYIVIRWPGYCISDTIDQISQVLFPDNVFTSQYLDLIDEDVKLNQHHPVFTTFIYAFFYRFGANLGHPTLGMGLLTCLQCAGIALGMGYTLDYIRARRAPRKYIIAILIFYAVFPVNPICSTLIAKDGLFTIAFIFAQLSLVKLCEKENISESIGDAVRLGAWMLICMLIRHNAIYVGILLGVSLLVIYRKKAVKPAATVITAACLVLMLNNLILPALSITKTDDCSALSLPFITTARVCIEHFDEITEEEKEAIVKILGEDGYEYNPVLADGITAGYNYKATAEDKINYLKTSVKMGFKYPGTYIKALLWFWSPMYAAHNELQSDFEYVPASVMGGDVYILPTGEMSAIGVENSKYMIKHAEKFQYVQGAVFGMTWPFNIFYGCDLYFWSIIILLTYLRLKRRLKDSIGIFTMCIFTIISIMAGPVSYIRYMYPVAVVLPLLFSIAVFRKERRSA